MRDALWEKVEKCKNLSMPYEKVQKFAEEIEIAMFGKTALFCFILVCATEDNYLTIYYLLSTI